MPSGVLDADHVIVGSGLTGAVIARTLHDAGKQVLVIERRTHVGGNVHDQRHASGIWFHTYGPHYFRTSSDEIWKFVTRFSAFRDFSAVLKARIGNRFFPWPLNATMIEALKDADQPKRPDVADNFEAAALQKMPRRAYEMFVKTYTQKQWGVRPSSLSADLAKRIDIRRDDDPRLKTSKYQGLPRDGYSALMQNMLSGIPLVTGTSFNTIRAQLPAGARLVYTGPIDEFFDFDLGRLKWRGQKRKVLHHAGGLRFPACQVNFPSQRERAIRVIEWAHLMPPGSQFDGTLLTYETPYHPSDPAHYEYPFPDLANQRLYERYRLRAEAIDRVVICGRLGEYRYYDMDQAIGRAMMIARKILSR